MKPEDVHVSVGLQSTGDIVQMLQTLCSKEFMLVLISSDILFNLCLHYLKFQNFF